MTVLVQMLFPNASKSVLCPDIMDAGPSLFDQLLDEEVLRSRELHSRAIGPIAGYMKSRSIVDIHLYTVGVCTESLLVSHV